MAAPRIALRGDLLDFVATPARADRDSRAVRWRPDHWLLIEGATIVGAQAAAPDVTWQRIDHAGQRLGQDQRRAAGRVGVDRQQAAGDAGVQRRHALGMAAAGRSARRYLPVCTALARSSSDSSRSYCRLRRKNVRERRLRRSISQ